MLGERPQTDESDRGNADNQIFHVKDAVPPTDFDAPYSRLPSNVVLTRVKVITAFYIFTEKRELIFNLPKQKSHARMEQDI